MDEIRPVNGVVKDEHIKDEIKNYIMIIVATLIYAVSTYIFVLDSDFAPSGLSGILAMVEHFRGLNTGTFTLLFINVPLLILGFFFLKKNFVIKTTLSVFILCGTLFVLEAIDPEHKLRFDIMTETLGKSSAQTIIVEGNEVLIPSFEVAVQFADFGKKFFCSIVGGIFAGIAIAMSFRAQASLGGVDIIVMIIQKKKPHVNVSVLLCAFNFIIIIMSVFVYKNVESICFALIYIIIFSKVCEYILNGVKKALKFEVVTEHPEELAKEIIDKLGHSVTVSKVRGMYANSNKYMLVCVIRSRQIAVFEKILKNYPDTFAFSSSVSEVFGKFYR